MSVLLSCAFPQARGDFKKRCSCPDLPVLPQEAPVLAAASAPLSCFGAWQAPATFPTRSCHDVRMQQMQV